MAIKEFRSLNFGGEDTYVPAMSDWNASEGEPGYIKNRTHWEVRTPIVENVSFTGLWRYGGNYPSDISIGTTYHFAVSIEDSVTEYDCVAYEADFGDEGVRTLIGNGRFLGVDGGEDVPFVYDPTKKSIYTTIDCSFSIDTSNNGVSAFRDGYASCFYGNGELVNCTVYTPVNAPLVAGKTYCLTLNGIDYDCEATDEGDYVRLKAVNDYFLYCYWYYGEPEMQVSLEKAGENIFSIYEADVHKLASKYLPPVSAKHDLILIGPPSFDDDVVNDTEFVGSVEEISNAIVNGGIPNVYFKDYDHSCFCQAISMKFDRDRLYIKFNHPDHGAFTYVMRQYGYDFYIYDFLTE